MAGMGLSSPNRLQDRLSAWLTASATSPTLINYGLGGQTMAALRPTANGGTVGRNIDTALAENPTIVFIDEPTNWAASYDVATQVSYMLEIFNYAFARGVLVIFTGSRPSHPILRDSGHAPGRPKYPAFSTSGAEICNCINFSDFLQPSTIADLRVDYDQGDGIHINAIGVQALADDITAFWVKTFRAVSAFNQYQLETSANGTTGWALNQNSIGHDAQSTFCHGRNRVLSRPRETEDGSFTDFSAVIQLTFEEAPVERRILVDFGGDGIADDGQTDGGIMTPNNSIPTGTPGQDATLKWWNNIVFARAGVLNADLVDILNVATGISITTDKKPGGTFAPVDYSMNYGGTVAAVSDYPSTAVRDNVYFHTTAGIVTWTIPIPAGKRLRLNSGATEPTRLQGFTNQESRGRNMAGIQCRQ